jgi:hypothetical protein
MITCHSRCQIDPDRIEDFEPFARAWIDLVNRSLRHASRVLSSGRGCQHVHVPGQVDRAIRQRPDRADVAAEVQIPGRLDAPVRVTLGGP